MEDSNAETEPLSPPSTSTGKSDAEFLQEFGITKSCRVCLSRIGRFWLSSAKQIPENEFRFHQKRLRDKVFRVHYGRHFLKQIADYAYRSAPDYTFVDFDQLYSTYITSRFSSMDRVRFKSIVQSYHAQWQNDFNRRRADLIAKKVAEVNAKKKAALKKRKIFYKGSCVIVSDGISEEAKKALQNGRRYKVVLERIFMDSPQSCVSEEQLLPENDQDVPQSPSDGSTTDDLEEDPRIVTHKLIRDLIEKTSQELENAGYFDFVEEEEDYVVQDNNAHESDDQATDDSDDTIESPMEVEFGSGESPDFSKVLRISHQEEFGDSEETCHGDEFVTQSRSSYTCDTDQSNSGLPTENGQDSEGKHDTNNSSDDAEGNNCVIKQAIRNQNKSIVVVPMKLCN